MTQDRAVCESCKQEVAIRKDGNLRTHRAAAPAFRDRARRVPGCPGSGRPAGTIKSFGEA